MHSIRTLLADIIDYAGLFPPAALDTESSAKNYARYRTGPHAWMLGRFILPATRLVEFAEAAGPLLRDSDAWRLSAICGLSVAQDLRSIDAFHKRGLAAQVDTLEIKATRPEEILTAAKEVHQKFTAYFEIPLASEPTDFIRCIVEAGARAKMRSGGTTPESIPESHAVARFILSCAGSGVPFKATAGLHHPLRGLHSLTARQDSQRAEMHGFLNVFLAAAFARIGCSLPELIELLNETAVDAFRFERDSIRWRNRAVGNEVLAQIRQTFAIAFGSCSFEEPVEDLKAISLL